MINSYASAILLVHLNLFFKLLFRNLFKCHDRNTIGLATLTPFSFDIFREFSAENLREPAENPLEKQKLLRFLGLKNVTFLKLVG